MPGQHRRRRLAILGLLFTAALIAASCSEAEESADDEPTSTTPPTTAATDDGATTDTEAPEPDDDGDEETPPETTAAAGGGDSVVEQTAGEDWFLGTVPDLPVAADESLEPIRIGIINQEDTPAGSFPEMRFAADAAVRFINAELGGVDGRPLELVPCIVSFAVEQSQACAQELVQEDVVALVGGVDVMAAGSLPVLEQNGLPLIGGIPAGLTEQQSEVAFAFSGGGSGGIAAMVKHAADNGAESVMIAYGDFESFAVAARDYGGAVAQDLGLEVELFAFPILSTDFLPVLNRAIEVEADAVIVAAADTACVPVIQGFRDLGIDGQLYLVGACAAEQIIEAADGAEEGVIFTSEGTPDDDAVGGTIFDLATAQYAQGPAEAAGTVGFRGMMNLYGLLLELGADGVSSEAILELIRSTVDRPSFWGHPYTCDGNQVPGLRSLCAPQQALLVIADGDANNVSYVSDWIDTAELFQNALG